MTSVKKFSAVILSAALFPAGGCFFSSSDPDPPLAQNTTVIDGTLIVDWSISRTTDPAQCQQGGARTIDIIITGAGGGEFIQECGVFATSISLPPGVYGGTAVLLDDRGASRTTAVQLGSFEIFGGDKLTIPIDFPASSFR